MFGSVKGTSCTASFERISAGIPLLRTNGGIEDGIVGGKGRSFLSWLWRGDDGGDGNLLVAHKLFSVNATFAAPAAGEMAGKLDSGVWFCGWRVRSTSLGGWWWCSFGFWQEDAKCDKSWVRTGTLILSVVIRNWDTLVAHSLNPARYFAIAASSVTEEKEINWNHDDVIGIIFHGLDTSMLLTSRRLSYSFHAGPDNTRSAIWSSQLLNSKSMECRCSYMNGSSWQLFVLYIYTISHATKQNNNKDFLYILKFGNYRKSS